jgi:hypothetical protein
VIRVPLEGDASITLDAKCREDEMRLRRWLRRTRRIVHLQNALEGLLDDLDAFDEQKAAA